MDVEKARMGKRVSYVHEKKACIDVRPNLHLFHVHLSCMSEGQTRKFDVIY